MKNRGCIFGSIGVLGILAIFFLIAISKYNNLIKKDELVGEQWGNVNTAYQKRADLVDNLVAIVQGYADFEKETLTQVIEARANATKINLNVDNLSQANLDQFQQAQQGLTGALNKLMVVVERYPDLKANQGFLNLQNQLENIENEIRHERVKYNRTARDFNTYRNVFPNVLVAGMFSKFEEKGYFSADEGAENAPTVEFNNNSQGQDQGSNNNSQGGSTNGTNGTTNPNANSPSKENNAPTPEPAKAN